MESPSDSSHSSRRASGDNTHRIGVSALRAEQVNAAVTRSPSASPQPASRSNGAHTPARATEVGTTSTSSSASGATSSGAASQPLQHPPQHSLSSSHVSNQHAHSSNGSKPRRTCLLIVDVQNDFVCGSLRAPNAEEIIPIINSLRCAHAWDLVVFTGDAHPEEHVSFHANHLSNPAAMLFQPLKLPSGQEQVMWPIHCIKDTWGAALHNDLVREPHTDILVEKGVAPDQEYYSAFKSTCGRHHTNLESLLHEHRITDVITCGLVYEYCVGNTAVDSANAGFKTFLLTDATKSLTEEGRLAMQAKLLEAGVTITSSNHLAGQVGLKPQRAQSMLNSKAQGSEVSGVTAAAAPEPSASGASTPVLRNNVARTFSSPQASASSYDSYSAAPTRASSNATAASSAASTPAMLSPSQSCAGCESQASSAAPSASPSAAGAAASSTSSAVSPSSSSPRPRVLLGLSGSVATIKVLDLLSALQSWAGEVRVVATSRALHFVSADEIRSKGVTLYTDEDEWNPKPWKRGDSVLHVEVRWERGREVDDRLDARAVWLDSHLCVCMLCCLPVLVCSGQLRRWADLLVIAPLSANTLAKLSHGLCDNLLSTLVRAWDWRGGVPVVLAPAMNTLMWENPMTSRQLAALAELSPIGSGCVHVVSPESKTLACGDVGTGAMAAVESVAAVAREAWERRSKSNGDTQADVAESGR